MFKKPAALAPTGEQHPIYTSPELYDLNKALMEYRKKYKDSLNVGCRVMHDWGKTAMLFTGFDTMFNIELTDLGLAIRTVAYSGYVTLLSEEFIINVMDPVQVAHITRAIRLRL